MDNFGELHQNLGVGTPQGSILSPLLCNIFLHELDTFVESLQTKYRIGAKRRRNKEYQSLANKVKWMKKRGTDGTERDKFLTMVKQMVKIPSVTHDETYIRIHYVRYADDFVIGVEGSHALSVTVLTEVSEFITETLGLKLNESKTGIVSITRKPFEFLGYLICAPYKEGSSRGLETIKDPKSGRLVRRRCKERMSLYLNLEKVLKRLVANGFVTKRIKPGTNDVLGHRGTFRGNLVNLDHADIVRYYNAVIRGIYNYYKIVNNMRKLAHII